MGRLGLNAVSPEASLGSLWAGFVLLNCFSHPVSLKGAWRPSLNISTLLTSIQLLMAEPNPDDPLMADIVRELLFLSCGHGHRLGRNGVLDLGCASASLALD